MTLSSDEYIALIIAQLGGDTTDELLATNLPSYWELRASYADLDTRALAVKIDAIDLLLGASWRKVSFKALNGASVDLSDMFDNLTRLRDLYVGQLASSGPDAGVAVGTIEKTAPLMPPSGGEIDPNAQRYRGDTRRWRP